MKTRWTVVLCLIVVLSLSLGGATFAASSRPGAGPVELQVTEHDIGRAVDINGQVLVVKLRSNPATGYSWQAQGLDGRMLRQLDASEWLPDVSGKIGGPGTQVLRFAALARGRTTLNLVYSRPWESAAAPAKSFSLRVNATKPSQNVSYAPPAAEAPAQPDRVSATALPASYNACPTGGCTPIRDQGQCGSCWAFATAGPVEQNILIKDGASKDLSEQWLVSCNTDGYSCNGGWWVLKYYVSPGAVYESDFPYTATDAPCGGPYTYHEKIASWAYVGNSSSVPSIDAMKQAIYDHGPITAGVCVNNAFQAYTGGVFNSTRFCFSINHGVVLVGWDDSVGAWILRNSWGPNWGENGYMRIAYGTNRVGYAAAYVVYNGTTPPTTPAAPSGLSTTAVSSSEIALTWTDNATNETLFKIERCTGEGCSNFAQIGTVGANVTTYSNTGLAASTSYSYRVRAYNDAGDSGYSDPATATTLEPPPTGDTVTVASLDGSATIMNKNFWRATVVATIYPALSGAVVSGTWSGGSTATCTTDGSGACSVSTNVRTKTTLSITFTVSDVALAGYTYVRGVTTVTVEYP